MHVTGSIPKNMMYISQEATDVGGFWENANDQTATKIKVFPTFPADAYNPKSIETGMNWGSGYRNGNKAPTTIARPNDPMSYVRIVGLEIRSEGGRAYKVILDGDLYVDLREDVLLDTMIQVGVSKGGILKGTFIWARVGSQMKLVRVGSELHDALLKNTELATKKKITQFEVGGVYRGKSPDEFIYLGNFDTVKFETIHQPATGWNTPRTSTFIYKELKNHMVFMKKYKHYGNTIKEMIENVEKGYGSLSYLCSFKKSHTFVEKVEQLEALDIQAYIDDKMSKPLPPKRYDDSLQYCSEINCILS